MSSLALLSTLLLASFAAQAEQAAPPAKTPPPDTSPAEAPADSPSDLIDQTRILESLRALPVKRSPNADKQHAEGLAKTEVWLVAQLRSLGLEPRLEPMRWAPPIRPNEENQRPEPREWNNIIVEFEGMLDETIDLGVNPQPDTQSGVDRLVNGKSPRRNVLLIGAHFDAVPNAPGADDNASGTAALLELARAFKSMHDHGWTHHQTIRLVFFNLEEVGLVGSRHHLARWAVANKKANDHEGAAATNHEDPKDANTDDPARVPAALHVPETLSLMLSLESIGFFSDAPNSQQSPFPAIPGVFEPPTVADNIVLVTTLKHKDACRRLASKMIAAAPGLKVFNADFSPVALPDLMRSDHAPFLLAGLPAIMVTDTANFRNPNYHRPTDIIETLDPARLTRVTRGLAGAIWDLAMPIAPKPTATTPAAKPPSPQPNHAR